MSVDHELKVLLEFYERKKMIINRNRTCDDVLYIRRMYNIDEIITHVSAVGVGSFFIENPFGGIDFVQVKGTRIVPVGQNLKPKTIRRFLEKFYPDGGWNIRNPESLRLPDKLKIRGKTYQKRMGYNQLYYGSMSC